MGTLFLLFSPRRDVRSTSRRKNTNEIRISRAGKIRGTKDPFEEERHEEVGLGPGLVGASRGRRSDRSVRVRTTTNRVTCFGKGWEDLFDVSTFEDEILWKRFSEVFGSCVWKCSSYASCISLTRLFFLLRQDAQHHSLRSVRCQGKGVLRTGRFGLDIGEPTCHGIRDASLRSIGFRRSRFRVWSGGMRVRVLYDASQAQVSGGGLGTGKGRESDSYEEGGWH